YRSPSDNFYSSRIQTKSDATASITTLNLGLRPGVPPVSSPAIFVTSTKLGCEAGRQMEYLAAIRVPAMRRLIQVSDGVSVHLKKDLIDKLLYRTTMGLRVGGVVYCLVALYVAAQPSNK
uniref:Cytochrome c oxidase subunit 7A2 like n=1 Tax=Amphiprion percula TaxID=161767 RepID=A0A3P8TCT3_AMPPE